MTETIGLCRSSTKKCSVCQQPITFKEAIIRLSKKKSCHYCCSFQYDVGFVANEKDLKEIFYDFLRHHKEKFKTK